MDNLTDNLIDIVNTFPPEILTQINKLVLVSKIAVYIFIGYIVFLIIKNIMTWRRNVRINIIYQKINEIDKKLDKLLKKEIKEEIKKQKNPKKGFFKKLFKKHKKSKKSKKD